MEARRQAGRSAVILSTCNRFEIYWSGDDDVEPWFRELARARGVDVTTVLTRLDGAAAARHLFGVAAGLDSQILGETEILGQVRRAHRAAETSGTITRELDAVFCAAIAAGRRVRRETPLGHHPASVSSAAVDVGLEAMGECGARAAVVLGAGEVAEGVVRALIERGVSGVTLVNRRPERAAALAARLGVAARPWDELPSLLSAADLLFVATGAKHPVVHAADLERRTTPTRRDLVALDLAVPRNVDPSVRTLPGIRLFNLDDLQELRCPAAGEPSIAVAEAGRIIGEELKRLEGSLRARLSAPHLAELHRIGAELAREEADRALADLEGFSEAEQRVVREMAERLVRRVLYPVSRSLRAEDERSA